MYKWLTVTPEDIQVSNEQTAWLGERAISECCPVAVAATRTFGSKARACESLILVTDPGYNRWIPSPSLRDAIRAYDAHQPFPPGRYKITLAK